MIRLAHNKTGVQSTYLYLFAIYDDAARKLAHQSGAQIHYLETNERRLKLKLKLKLERSRRAAGDDLHFQLCLKDFYSICFKACPDECR